jgi:hypothetical protein
VLPLFEVQVADDRRPREAVEGVRVFGRSTDEGVPLLLDGYAFGSLSMTAYPLGMECPPSHADGGSPQVGADLPPDGSNI